MYSYVKKEKFILSKNTITYFTKNDTIKQEFKYFAKDSTIIIGNKKYNFWKYNPENNSYYTYNLLNLEKEKNVTSDSLRKFENGFHLFKNSKNYLKIKLNDKITSNLDFIKPFIFDSDLHSDFYITVIYLGEKLKDLLKCYIKLWKVNRRAAMLITSIDFESNMYEGFLDTFQIWNEEISLMSTSNKQFEPPLRLEENNRKKYLEIYTPKIIKINSLKDFHKIQTMTKNKNYLIQINTNINLKIYISLKEKITKIKKNKKINIRTEFI